MNGILNLYKPSGITSHDAVARCRRLFGIRRVGHAGTLDPMATGVLPILIGNACSAQEEIMNHDKVYIAGVRFGAMTDTGDVTGNILTESKDIPSESEIESCVASFIGEYDQIPPMYSAIKIGGQKLYDLARQGITVERKARRVAVYSADILKKQTEGVNANDFASDYLIRFSVSKGTYIRTLAEDIGSRLGCGACLYSLERTECGAFKASESVTLEELEGELTDSGGEKSILSRHLISAEVAFEGLPRVILSEFYSRLCKNGNEIYLNKAKLNEGDFSTDGRCRLYDSDNTFFALGRLCDYESGRAVKAYVRFDTK